MFNTLYCFKINLYIILIVFNIDQGSVEGIAHDPFENALYWTCNNEATVNRLQLGVEEKKVVPIIKLSENDKPRGIEVDSCNK